MPPPTPHSGFGHHATLRSRIQAALLSLAMLALFILALLRLGLMPGGDGKVHGALVAIDLTASPQAAREPAHAQAHARARASRPTPVVPRPVETPEPKRPPFKLIELTSNEFAASDISRMPRHAEAAADSNSGGGSSGAAGPGEGPGGAHLFNAEWVREPSNAEMAGYLPERNAAGEWAMIACKTIEHNRVEDCQELGEANPGGGLARALRQAAWQFLIRPPRVDGKPMIGTWVRIRFDFTHGVR